MAHSSERGPRPPLPGSALLTLDPDDADHHGQKTAAITPAITMTTPVLGVELLQDDGAVRIGLQLASASRSVLWAPSGVMGEDDRAVDLPTDPGHSPDHRCGVSGGRSACVAFKGAIAVQLLGIRTSALVAGSAGRGCESVWGRTHNPPVVGSSPRRLCQKYSSKVQQRGRSSAMSRVSR